ncbi:MAG: PDZ domain-containing protein [Bacteroidota bacterium]
MKKILSIAGLIFSVYYAQAQSLPRKVFLGIRMEAVTDDARKIMGIESKNGVLISEVFANSTAESAGFKRGDILLKINGQSFNSTNEVISYLNKQNAGNSFTYWISRDKKLVEGKAVFQPQPKEKHEGIEMIYTEAKTLLGQQRIIISKAADQKGKAPAIVFIGGIGCYSLDFTFNPTASEVQLLNGLSRNGYLCARAEKPGMGDNAKTKACSEVSFMEEMKGYVDMIKTLKQRPDVDSNAVYIFGHSMGGLFAPLIAKETNLKGIIAYGTIGSNFLEYLIKTRKTIAEAYNMPPEESDDLVKDFCECSVYYFADTMTTVQAETKKHGCRELLSLFDLRSRQYNNELYSFNIPSLWRSYGGKALLLWGNADYISSEDDHKMIAGVVNRYHPGNADFEVVKNCDHGMLTASSFQDARLNPGVYNDAVGKAVLNWLKRI